MKNRMLGTAIALSMIAVLVMPLNIWAQEQVGTTEIIGELSDDLTFIPPADFAWDGGIFSITTNKGTASEGSIITNTTWTLTVTDTKTNHNGYMTVNGADDADAVKLTSPIEVGMTEASCGTISDYQSELESIEAYGESGTFIIPLYASQEVTQTDTPGPYSITLTYTVTPGT
jgi:hypothetical protein